MKLKRKTMARTEWKGIEKRLYADMPFEEVGVRGRVGLLYMEKVDEPFAVPSPMGGQVFITHTGYSWLQIAPEGKNLWATVMFDGEGRFIECYFDVTLETCPLPENRSWFTDLFLDYVLYPDGTLLECDMDELDAALDETTITPEQHAMAKQVGAWLKQALLGRHQAFIDLCGNYRQKLISKLQ